MELNTKLKKVSYTNFVLMKQPIELEYNEAKFLWERGNSRICTWEANLKLLIFAEV